MNGRTVEITKKPRTKKSKKGKLRGSLLVKPTLYIGRGQPGDGNGRGYGYTKGMDDRHCFMIQTKHDLNTNQHCMYLSTLCSTKPFCGHCSTQAAVSTPNTQRP
jgi:hypothetical protein